MKKQEAEGSTSKRRQLQGLPLIRTDVAGIDIGSERHWVCAPTIDGQGREIASFGATTAELIRLAEWLQARHVKSVAMESTGVYWIAPHEVLEAKGLEMRLVDTRQLARVPGRDKKTDPTDCEWIQRLHSCGLLRGCFRPPEAICKLRTLVRDKGVLVAESGDWLRRMQKSLDQMNVRVHRAVSDINGTTGLAIIRAILAGVLRGVVSQRLLPRQEGGGRVAAVEVMVNNSRISDLIRESRTEEITDAIAEGQFFDMQTFTQALIELVVAGEIDREVAANASTNRHDFMVSLDQALKRKAAGVETDRPVSEMEPEPPKPGETPIPELRIAGSQDG